MNASSSVRSRSAALDLFKIFFYVLVCLRRPAAYLWWKSVGFEVAGSLGLYERPHFRFLSSALPAGGRFVDVGAHYGVYTRFLLGCAGDKGVVFAFEPHPEVFAALEHRFAGRPNCRLIRVALSARRRDGAYLRVPKLRGIVPEPALSHVISSFEPGAVPVEVRCLDDFADELSAVDFVKADVEGGELDFLEGASAVLERGRPLVLFECNDMIRRYDAVLRLAEASGYALCGLDAGGRLRAVTPEDLPRRDVNFYLVPRERVPSAGGTTR
jgi:FkbM family methyltransferase